MRPQSLNPAPHFDLRQPVLEQPNSGSVLDMITMKAENMARLELGLPMTKDGLLDLYEVLTTAPGAGQAVRTGIYKEEDSPGATQRKQTLEHLAGQVLRDRDQGTPSRRVPGADQPCERKAQAAGGRRTGIDGAHAATDRRGQRPHPGALERRG